MMGIYDQQFHFVKKIVFIYLTQMYVGAICINHQILPMTAAKFVRS